MQSNHSSPLHKNNSDDGHPVLLDTSCQIIDGYNSESREKCSSACNDIDEESVSNLKKMKTQEITSDQCLREPMVQAAQKLKCKRERSKKLLEKQIHQLEKRQNNLLSLIQSLNMYKEHLESKCELIGTYTKPMR